MLGRDRIGSASSATTSISPSARNVIAARCSLASKTTLRPILIITTTLLTTPFPTTLTQARRVSNIASIPRLQSLPAYRTKPPISTTPKVRSWRGKEDCPASPPWLGGTAALGRAAVGNLEFGECRLRVFLVLNNGRRRNGDSRGSSARMTKKIV